MQRHLARVSRHFGPIAKAAEMPAVAKADHRDPFLRGLPDAKLGRIFADHLSKSAIAIDDRERVRIEYQRRRLIRLEPAVARPFEIFADADHAVRIMADQVRIDEATGDGARFFDARSG